MIQRLDGSKAEQLLGEKPNTKGMLERYPEGIQSLDTGLTGTPRRKGEHSKIITIASDPVPVFDPTEARLHEEIKKQRNAILELARHDLKLESALALPGNQAQALIVVGRRGGERNPSIAKMAIKDAITLAARFDPVFRLDILKDAADVYWDLNDHDAALKIIGDGTKLAEELYAKDTDSSGPNPALKALWPSTNVWRQFVGLAARISPDVATKLIDEVPDSEIHAFLRVALASSLVGQEPRAVHSVRRNEEHEIMEV